MLFITEDKNGQQVVNLSRGDDAALEVPLKDLNDEPFELGQTESLIFDVRVLPREDSELLIHIVSVPGTTRIVFTHDDTKDLEVGPYSAEIQLMTADKKRITIWPEPIGKQKIRDRINRKNFILMPEVVYS